MSDAMNLSIDVWGMANERETLNVYISTDALIKDLWNLLVKRRGHPLNLYANGTLITEINLPCSTLKGYNLVLVPESLPIPVVVFWTGQTIIYACHPQTSVYRLVEHIQEIMKCSVTLYVDNKPFKDFTVPCSTLKERRVVVDRG